MTNRLLPCLMLLIPLTACGSSDTSASGDCTADTATATTTIDLKDTAFSPTCISVSAGAVVTFKNQDAVAHDVVTDGAKPTDSGSLAQNATFQATYATAGTFDVTCSIHPSMKATIIVQ